MGMQLSVAGLFLEAELTYENWIVNLIASLMEIFIPHFCFNICLRKVLSNLLNRFRKTYASRHIYYTH